MEMYFRKYISWKPSPLRRRRLSLIIYLLLLLFLLLLRANSPEMDCRPMRRSPGSWWGTRTGDTGRTLVVRVADRCAVDWLTVRLRRMVLRTLEGITGLDDLDVRFEEG